MAGIHDGASDTTTKPATTDQQIALSQSVQTQAQQDAAPSTKWGKFVATTEAGIKDIPAGIVHTLEHPMDLLKNGAISVGMGVAAKNLVAGIWTTRFASRCRSRCILCRANCRSDLSRL